VKHCLPGSQQASSASARSAGARSAGAGTSVGVELREYCYRLDSSGRQHFNFRQCIWLQPQVAMAMTPVVTIALRTLAANLLSLALRDHEHAVAGSDNPLIATLARRFCEQCLLTAGAGGWVIPRASIRAWVAAQRRRGPPV